MVWGIVLENNKEMTLARQIYIGIKKQAMTGQIRQGETLPSTRELAKSLGVSRNTVSEAYDMLWAEGFIVRRQGAPSRVAEGLLIRAEQIGREQKQKEEPSSEILWDFKTGQPDLSVFPWAIWRRIVSETAGRLCADQMEYSGPKGYEPLCVEIAGWLMRSRSMRVAPEDIFITSGATQALHLLVDILHKKDHAFALENPSHPGIRTVIMDKGYPLCWMPVDGKGADITSLQGKKLSAVYVTPSHQYPLGGILPAARRAALIRAAAEKDCFIIEDDYDSEFRYGGSPITPIFSMDPTRVVYVGTFSKTIFPAIRLGFAVLPKPLQSKWKHFRNYMDVQNPILEQAALSEFLGTRKMDKHVQKMRRVYGEKRDILIQSVKKTFGENIDPWGDASGLHITLQFPGHRFTDKFLAKCREGGIRIATLSSYCADPDEHRDKLLLGYSHLDIAEIESGIGRLQKIIMEGQCTL